MSILVNNLATFRKIRTTLDSALLAAALLFSFLFSDAGISAELTAQEKNEQLCPASFIANQPKPIAGDNTDKRIHVSADSAKVDSESVTFFEGHVVARRGARTLEADSVRYDRNTEIVDAQGNIIYSTSDIRILGDSLSANLGTEKGVVDNAQYYTGSVNGRGEADRIVLKSQTEVELEDASFTTCPPESETWALRANTIELDNETKQGTADNVVLEIANIPVLYLPYIRFPISEDRMSGFLYPGLKVSDKHGTEISLPYYWNIAPQMDATITPHNMTRRGVMLETEFRYLAQNSSGNIDVNYLPDDKLFNDDRAQIRWKHSGSLTSGWSSSVDYNYVSDTSYLDDFAGSLGSSSVTHLNREGRLAYNADTFSFSALLQNYQSISGEEPYERAPQINLDSRFTNRDNHLNYDINTEYVNFDHKDKSRVIGQRMNLNPYVSYPVQAEAGFFIPKLSLHHLQYDLDQLASPGDNDTPSASVPVFSTDMGLFFERDTHFGGKDLLHTLEPRLFYLYAPYKDQDALPVFDTALTTFGQSLLFSENRFSGKDRVGDANQLTTAITTRFYLQDTGQEVFNATLGQIIYFQDRRVTLPGAAVETKDRSSYIGLLSFAPNPRFKVTGDIQWEPETKHTEVGNYRISYQADRGRVLNLDYRFRRNEIRTQGFSFGWRFTPRWQMFGGHQYDLENNHRLENFLGIRYESCCWAVRLVGHEKFDTLVGTDPRFENAVYLEFQLKGLSSLGSRKDIDTLIENGILGYSE